MSNKKESFEDYIKNYNPDKDIDETFWDGSSYIDEKTGKTIGAFYKKHKNNKVWWIDNFDRIGEYLFSFDKKKAYNLFTDYPYKLTKEEKEIFDRENSYWKDFFKDRTIK